jgi:hypothetical protein
MRRILRVIATAIIIKNQYRRAERTGRRPIGCNRGPGIGIECRSHDPYRAFSGGVLFYRRP